MTGQTGENLALAQFTVIGCNMLAYWIDYKAS